MGERGGEDFQKWWEVDPKIGGRWEWGKEGGRTFKNGGKLTLRLVEMGMAEGGRRTFKNGGKLALRLVEDGNGGKRGGGLSKIVGS